MGFRVHRCRRGKLMGLDKNTCLDEAEDKIIACDSCKHYDTDYYDYPCNECEYCYGHVNKYEYRSGQTLK